MTPRSGDKKQHCHGKFALLMVHFLRHWLVMLS